MPDDTLDAFLAIIEGFNRRFPKGREPYQIMTRLLEEGGELAQQVNHFEGAGTKRAKYGEPDRAHLAKEVFDVVLCALQVAAYYGVEAELRETIARYYGRLRDEGYIKDDQTSEVSETSEV